MIILLLMRLNLLAQMADIVIIMKPSQIMFDLPSELYSDKLGESLPLPLPLPSPPSKEKDASDKLHETIREAIEFKKMLSKQLQSWP